MAHYHDFDDNEQWAPVSDLIAVLMLIFMLIVVVYIRIATTEEVNTQNEPTEQPAPVKAEEPEEQAEPAKTHAEIFQAECDKIYYDLRNEFRDDFEKWQAELFPNLAIRFKDPDILFTDGEAEPKPEFKELLANFFPRYMRQVHVYIGDVHEIRIEGHTSSKWHYAKSEPEAYMSNMELSQDRARAILRHVMFDIPEAEEYNKWARRLVTANGLSSSKRILTSHKDGLIETEDEKASRRVEFRLMVKSCLQET